MGLKRRLTSIQSFLANWRPRLVQPLADFGYSTFAYADLPSALRSVRGLASSYLPFATTGDMTLALHLWPGRELFRSPVVMLSHGSAAYLADSLPGLPTALFLCEFRNARQDDELDGLRLKTEALCSAIPDSRPPSRSLLNYLASADPAPRMWTPRANSSTARAWVLARVGHPFAALPRLPVDIDSRKEGLRCLTDFDRSVPELVSLHLAIVRTPGDPDRAEEALQVLGAEAWRNQASFVEDPEYRMEGSGIVEWDCTLKHMRNPAKVLSSTVFEPLIGHPLAYSSAPDGPAALLEVAALAERRGDLALALRQVRNACTRHGRETSSDAIEAAARHASTCRLLDRSHAATEIAEMMVSVVRDPYGSGASDSSINEDSEDSGED